MKYAIVEEITDRKQFWAYQPWLKKGAKFFKSFQEVPNDYIVVANYPAWLDPLKLWANAGGKFIEIEWGYWGERPSVGKARIFTRRVSYCHSHNINMKKVPYSRLHTLTPKPEDWKKERGDILLCIEPHSDWVFQRTGMTFPQWKENFLSKILSYWDGPILWREKRGGAKANRFSSYIEDLKTVHAVVGERTMACVEAVMLGYPAYTVDVSAVTPLMGNDLSLLKNPLFPDRADWFEHIAWSQFHRHEFDDGTKVADMVEIYQMN